MTETLSWSWNYKWTSPRTGGFSTRNFSSKVGDHRRFNPAEHFTEPRPVIANAGKMDTTDPIHEYPADKERWLNSLWREGTDRLRRGYGVVSKQMDYLGARELTIFSKRGSARSGSHHGINLSWP